MPGEKARMEVWKSGSVKVFEGEWKALKQHWDFARSEKSEKRFYEAEKFFTGNHPGSERLEMRGIHLAID